VKEYIKDSMKLYNRDCMEGMAEYPDNYFDLAIVDPPYGIGESKRGFRGMGTACMSGNYTKKDWDNSAPTAEYFIELLRVSKNQIIWGANYMTDNLPPSMGWIFWDKQASGDFSDGELAYTSFNRALKKFNFAWMGMRQGDMKNKESRMHPTQKPVKLYSWLLQNYSSPEHKILDTHLGSASHAIAWHYFQKGGEFVGYELDEEYFEKSIKRIEQETAQISLF
jgi:site-specific DNA-methyltransferase (adenine-specific)